MKKNDPRFKTFQDFYVDILGGIIPGLLFLISIIISIGIPFMYVLLYVNRSFLKSGGNTNEVTKVDLLLTNIFQGWFWVIAFLTLVILAYVIGHIFYRMDINKPDGKDFERLKKDSMRKIRKEARKVRKGKIDYIYVSLPTNESLRITFDKCDDKRKNRSECRDKNEFFYFFFKLMGEIQNIVFNHQILNEDEESSTKSPAEVLEYFFGEKLLSLMDSWNNFVKTVISNENNPEFKLNIFIDKMKTDKLFINSGWAELIRLFSDFKDEKNMVKQSNKLNSNVVFLTLKKFVLPEYARSIKEEYQKELKIKKKENTSKNEFKILYSILFQQAENACDTEDNCKFPYMSYYKYILKRGFISLAEHTKWHISGLRTKNRINNYKLYIQTHHSQFYSIITKNESHIRMASSSWFVANILGRVIFVSTLAFSVVIVLISCDMVSLYEGTSTIDDDMTKNMLKHGLILLVPILNISLLYFLRRTVLKFIHYQRLREVFHTIQLYQICKDIEKKESEPVRKK